MSPLRLAQPGSPSLGPTSEGEAREGLPGEGPPGPFQLNCGEGPGPSAARLARRGERENRAGLRCGLGFPPGPQPWRRGVPLQLSSLGSGL